MAKGHQLDTGKKPKKKKPGFDWFEASVNGGSLILGVLKEAAEFAPVPFLKQAAGTTLKIVSTVQALKENKEDFQRLAEDATTVMNGILNSYKKSENKDGWPGDHLQGTVLDIIHTLGEVLKFVEAQLDRSRAVRVIYSIADVAKIREYRERLNHAMHQFGVTSHLELHETLSQMKKMMLEQQQGIEELKDEAAEKLKIRLKNEEELRVLRAKMLEEQLAAEEKEKEAKLRAARAKEDEERKRAEELEAEVRIMKEERRRKQKEEEKRRLQIEQLKLEEQEAERRRKEKEDIRKKLEDDLAREEALAKLRAKERMYFEDQDSTHKSDEDSEEDDEDEESDEESSEDSEVERARLEAEAARQKAARKAKRKAEKAGAATDDILQAEFARLGINPGSPSPPWGQPHSPPMQHHPGPGMYYPPYGHAPSPYYSPPGPPSYGGYGSPPYSPMPYAPGAWASPYGAFAAPGGSAISNTNSGNVTNSNISNVGNDHSMHIRKKGGKR